MGIDFIILMITTAVLIFCAAFFSCTETAITAVTQTEKHGLIPEKHAATIHLLSIRDEIVSATLVGTNLVNNITTSLVTAFTLNNFSNKNATKISTIIITVLIIFFAEILPKSLATQKALPIVKTCTPILQVVRYIFFPISAFLNLISNAILKVLAVFHKEKHLDITDEQLQILVDISAEDGALSFDEEKLLTGAIRLRDLKLRNIVTPIFEMKFVNARVKIPEAVAVFRETKVSRLPVCSNNDSNAVVGILHYKDILFNEEETSITSIMRDVVFVPETASIFKVIDIMQSKHTNIIIAIDEYGHNVGLATMDDIITAVFGTIQDEYDTVNKSDITAIDATHFRIAGEAKLYDINRELDINHTLNIDLQSDFYDTIAGLILETSEVLPNKNDIITIAGIDFKIEKITDRKIETVIADITKLLKKKKAENIGA